MREPLEIPPVLKSIVNAACMLAGVLTTLIAIGFATGLLHMEGILS